MDESQDLAELPKKKARHDPDIGQEAHQAIVANEDASSAERSDAAALGAEAVSYPASSLPHLDTVSGSSEQSHQDTETGNQTCDTDNTYTTNAVTCKDLTSTTDTEYTSQIYQGNNHAVTAYANQGAFSLSQSSVYSTFHQPAQTTYGLPPFGAMWPGIKTETELPEVASVGGQPGFLSFSTAYTSTPPSQAHYSYPSQGSCFTTSSVYTNIPTANVTATTTAAAPGNATQEFTTYNSLNQNQFSQYYVPPSNYLPAGLPSADGDSSGVVAAAYPGAKGEDAVPAVLPSTTDPSPAVALPTGAREQDDASRRNAPPGKSKGKAKKADNAQSTDNDLERVFLWDLDETIIIFHSLLTGTFAQKFGKDPTTVLNLGLQMEELIFELADTHLFFNDLEECDQVHVEDVASDDNGQDLSNYSFSTDGFTGPSGGGGSGPTAAVQGGVEWMRKLAFRYRRLKEIYNAYKGNAGGLLSPMKRDLLLRLRTEIETVTDSWLSIALKSLLLIQSRGRCMNVLVTTTQLVPALAKVLLYGLGEVFPIENIYSATKIGKESCFERIVSRFGKKVTYVVIGDGRDEEFAAKQHNMPFWRVSAHGDLVSLHQALELDFL
ncbi:eyes absent homolog 3 isoform X1 [Engraulis encrasicolus]|uniref:eyes absent homolog 3 isoform X1 n=1 Tax=Engraulis encrasicolus TaxID=184585 RepID=UPI002FD327B2